ncbi:hypothetical protein AGABI2DRAFT_115960 [Agaricus bisporus var. bisporus H97]|uniref:hypothetical protein n=1 Tax=Agaricus bisporus var. bisporus (strain H97 / ATCC MYA-4626 / FGSC 10389) TaxID=936046 RepID=UPI00029F7776|nr:hypothetical protein AGABI2DRAFT_115960 [Agaricus bisporus var. bisporus H97]EKV48911.1 hypothetical protein AGABI2DRAFT_115960 [Agaricus bisporus var. bisporus H97]
MQLDTELTPNDYVVSRNRAPNIDKSIGVKGEYEHKYHWQYGDVNLDCGRIVSGSNKRLGGSYPLQFARLTLLVALLSSPAHWLWDPLDFSPPLSDRVRQRQQLEMEESIRSAVTSQYVCLFCIMINTIYIFGEPEK